MLPPKRIDLKFQHPRDQWSKFLGLKLTEKDYDLLVDYDADVYSPEGEVIFKLRKSCIEPSITAQAFKVLRTIRAKTNNRIVAVSKGVAHFDKKQDGTVSRTMRVPIDLAVMTNIIGYYDRYIRFPFCRQTAFNANSPELFTQVLPFLQGCSQVYEREAPEKFKFHREAADKCHPAWIIPGTVFSTITVNQNWRTAVHTDKGDFKEGLGLITVLRGGEFTGGYLCFPHYRVAVHFDSCDLLMFNSHHMHGNTPIFGKVGAFERVSCVMYLREKMRFCQSPEEELDRAKNRKPGDSLYDESVADE